MVKLYGLVVSWKDEITRSFGGNDVKLCCISPYACGSNSFFLYYQVDEESKEVKIERVYLWKLRLYREN